MKVKAREGSASDVHATPASTKHGRKGVRTEPLAPWEGENLPERTRSLTAIEQDLGVVLVPRGSGGSEEGDG